MKKVPELFALPNPPRYHEPAQRQEASCIRQRSVQTVVYARGVDE